MSRLETEMSRTRRGFGGLTICMLDIDHFKRVNDTFGHTVGDTVLAEFAKLLMDGLREYDIVCRYGGEEFLAILPGTNLETAKQVVERIRENVASNTVEDNGVSVSVTVSIGVAEYQVDETVDEFVNRADRKLYEAKESGRNCVVADFSNMNWDES